MVKRITKISIKIVAVTVVAAKLFDTIVGRWITTRYIIHVF